MAEPAGQATLLSASCAQSAIGGIQIAATFTPVPLIPWESRSLVAGPGRAQLSPICGRLLLQPKLVHVCWTEAAAYSTHFLSLHGCPWS